MSHLIQQRRNNIRVGSLFRAGEENDDSSRTTTTNNKNNNNTKSSTVDILVATPQKLRTWIERLADEDEEEDEQQHQDHQQREEEQKNDNHNNNNMNDFFNNLLLQQGRTNSNNSNSSSTTKTITSIFGKTQLIVLDEADDLLSTNSFFTSMAGRIVDTIQEAVSLRGQTVLHKMLCSATLTSRISKVSDVALKNAKYFSLDAHGRNLDLLVQQQQQQQQTGDDGAGGGQIKRGVDIVRPLFPLPASLIEHFVIVRDDSKRHVTLLSTVGHALGELRERSREKQQQQGVTDTSSSSSWKSSGSSVLVFCQSAELARVMGHFLSMAGIDAIELTTLTTYAERRSAALAVATSSSSSSSSSSSTNQQQQKQKVIVVSDALMRGIDMPGVGSVIMYDPPSTLQQYIHRVGRTARAGATGSSYILLSKLGPSGTEADGQMAKFKSFDSMLLRQGKVFNKVKLRELNTDDVEMADRFLMATQQKLSEVGGWVSANNNTTTTNNTAAGGGAAAASSSSSSSSSTTQKTGKRRSRNL